MPAIRVTSQGSLFGFLRGMISMRPGRVKRVRQDSREEKRARNACIHDLLTSRPAAFANEMDVQYLMQMYPLDR